MELDREGIRIPIRQDIHLTIKRDTHILQLIKHVEDILLMDNNRLITKQMLGEDFHILQINKLVIRLITKQDIHLLILLMHVVRILQMHNNHILSNRIIS